MSSVIVNVSKAQTIKVSHPKGNVSAGYLTIKLGAETYVRIDNARAKEMADNIQIALREYEAARRRDSQKGEAES
jgi:hypothetical protein